MPDSILTPVPGDPPMVPTPLLTAQGLTVTAQFATDLAALCSKASLDGMTPVMICGQLWQLMTMVGFCLKDEVAAIPAPAPAPPPATLTTGNTVTLTVGTLTAAPIGTQVLTLALGPYSLELACTALNVLTYTANTLWPGVTLYGKSGDLMRMSVEADTVTTSISQDDGATWRSFYTYSRTETGTLTARVTSTEYAGAAQLVVTP